MRLIRIMLALALAGTVIALAAPTAGSAATVTAPRVVLYQGGGDPTQFGPAVQPPGANTVSTDPETITTTNDGTLEEDTSLTASGVTDGGEWWYDPSPTYVELHAFYWEEPDGTTVLAQNLTDAVGWYDLGNGVYTPECLAWEPYNTLDVQYIRLNLNNYTWSKATSSCTAALSDTAVATSLSGGGQSGTSISVPAGTTVTDTATLSGTNASTATGTVTYDVYSDSACTVAVSSGTAEAITTPGTLPDSDPVTLSTAGTYYWQASYSGDANNGPSTSACGTAGEVETVAQVVPTVSVADNASSISVGGTLIFTATVTGSGPTPTGTVSWTVTDPSGVSVPCSSTSGPTGSGSVATYTCSIPSAVAGTYSATADYPGDSNYGPASGTDDTADVVAATVTLNLSAAKVTYGKEKTEKLSVTITPAPATGTVTISYFPTTLCSINLSAGKGSCSLSNAQLAAGTYSLVATYAGEESAQKLLIVAKATSKTALKLSATKVTYGDEQVEQLSVTVTGQGKGLVPAGTVTIAESSTRICSISLTLGKGSCSLSAEQLAVGRYSLVATYAATTDFVGSASTKKTLTVVK